MPKKLTYQQKQYKMIVDAINEMFRIAGHDVTFEDVKDRQDAWYTEWTITQAQHEEWLQWGKRELMRRLRYPARYAETQMAMMGLMWGLKFSDL